MPTRPATPPAARCGRALAAIALVAAASCADDPAAPTSAAHTNARGPALRLAPDVAPPIEARVQGAGAAAADVVEAPPVLVSVLAINSTAVVWNQTGTGNFGLWRMSGTSPVADASGGWTPFAVSPGWQVEAAADFDRDGHTDLLFHQTGTNVFGIWRLTASTLQAPASGWTSFVTSPGWEVTDAADFDRDGSPDLVFTNPAAGQHGIWKMSGVTPRTDSNAWSELLASPGWRPEAAADFNGNGGPDVLWHQTGTGNFGVWTMNGAFQSGAGTSWVSFDVSPGWNVEDATDFDNDARPDLLFVNPTTGDRGVYLMNGTTPSTAPNAWATLPASGGWVPVAASRFGVASPRAFTVIGEGGTGSAFECAADAAGGTFCWGRNLAGQLGDATGVNRALPVAVQGISGVVRDIARGADFTCALTTAGQVYCWGLNDYGQLGMTTQFASRSVAAAVPFPTGVTAFGAVAAGRVHACAIASAGANAGYAYCWGSNWLGKLGKSAGCCDGADSPNPTPNQVPLPGRVENFSELVAGGDFTCALGSGGSRSGTVFCWGNLPESPYTETGDSWTPKAIAFPSGVTAYHGLASGPGAVCALAGPGPGPGDVYCWGDDGGYGAFGNPATSGLERMPPPDGASPFSVVTVGAWHSCAVPASGVYAGRPFCAGINWTGELGNATSFGTLARNGLLPVAVPPGTATITQIAAGGGYGDHTCALDANGVVYCWGNNDYGRLARGGFGGTTWVPAQIVVP